jgi:hypothetical protein
MRGALGALQTNRLINKCHALHSPLLLLDGKSEPPEGLSASTRFAGIYKAGQFSL